MTTISLEECKDTYVTSCTPAPPVDLPECEDGWEIGNGTAVCATQAPVADNLAVTGGDPTMSMFMLGVALGAILVGAYGVIWGQRRLQREEAAKAKAQENA
jgi:hypothetical protein